MLGLALGGPKDNAQGDSDGMGTSFLDEAVLNGGLKEENAKFTFIFNKDQSDFILGNNSDYIKKLEFNTIQLQRDSLYWRQKTGKDDKLGVTGLRVGETNYAIPKAVNTANMEYMFDTASQMIGIPSQNTWDSSAEDYYFFDRVIQTILDGKEYKNVCFQNSYYYNNGNSCYAVKCEPDEYDSVYFQLDGGHMFEVRPEDYILQELTVDLVDGKGFATGETYCRLAFTQTYDNVLRLGVMAMQGYTIEFNPNEQTISYAKSSGSSKKDVLNIEKKFTTKMPEPELPVRDECLFYGRNCPVSEKGTWTDLSTAKLVSTLGGCAVWFILLFWLAPLLPDFGEYAQALLAKLNKVKIDKLDSDLVVITPHEN